MDAIRVAEASRAKIPEVISGDHVAELLDNEYQDDCAYMMRSIRVTDSGSQVMKNKTVLLNILIRNITATEALIIKQEMLARGGDAALPREAVSHEVEKADIIITGTYLQIQRLIKKIKSQVRALPQIADMLSELLEKKNDTIFRYSR
ncbi:Uncharacterised protein [uncultured archaeon]|nr:Uncharacterised protein [uncultured archaeon]